MYVLVQHRISDPNTFWSTAQEALSNLPENLKLHHCLPIKDGSKGVCVWEADSVEALRDFLEPAVGHVSNNEYYEVENKEAIGLPSALQAA